jgi:TRAP-type mannitol/chloroaromatic compound transport system permease small subunit
MTQTIDFMAYSFFLLPLCLCAFVVYYFFLLPSAIVKSQETRLG